MIPLGTKIRHIFKKINGSIKGDSYATTVDCTLGCGKYAKKFILYQN